MNGNRLNWKFEIGNWKFKICNLQFSMERSDKGFTYIWLMIFITILCISVSAVVPVWKTVVKRNKEEELRFRLDSIRKGIKVYKTLYNKLPVDLSGLVSKKCLRKAYPDPMTGKLDWKLNGELGFSDIHSISSGESMRSNKDKKDYYSAW